MVLSEYIQWSWVKSEFMSLREKTGWNLLASPVVEFWKGHVIGFSHTAGAKILGL